MSILALGGRRRQSHLPEDMSTRAATPSSVGAFVNQSGYDVGRAKVATITNTPDGAVAFVRDAITGVARAVVAVTGGRADFSALDTPGIYRVECNGAVSRNFRIGKYWNQRVSVGPALAFMNQARSDTFLSGKLSIAWRDSHQFSFEMLGLCAQYAANPAAYTRMPFGILNASTCEYAELRTQDKPDIVWLIEFAVRRYVDLAAGGEQLHALTKEQLAFFLWLYPHLAQWIPSALYESARDLAVTEWATETTTKSWYNTGSSNNLYLTQSTIGPAKGSEPPGHKILPNLLMWEVATRDGLAGAQAFLDAAIANAEWLIALDITDPLNTKNQRMSEHVTMTGLCHLYEAHPEHAPAGTLAFIEQWAATALARSANLWDFRMYSSIAAGDTADRWTNTGDGNTPGGGGYNEPGSIAGLPAALLAAARVVSSQPTRDALERLAQAQFDQVFGRNPRGRHYCYRAATEFEGVEAGWHERYVGGNGALGDVVGVLDGAPLEGNYPFDPTVTGYTEGWVAFNSAWNHALAYHAASDVELSVLDPSTLESVPTATQGSNVLLRLRAPLNFNEAVVEQGWVEVSVDGGPPTQVVVTETSADAWTLDAAWTVPAGSAFTAAYGYGLFRHEAAVAIAPVP